MRRDSLMGKYKENVERHLLTAAEVHQMVQKAKRLQDKALVVLLWIFGCRISEAIVLKKEDIWTKDGKVFCSLPILKQRKRLVQPTHRLIVPEETPLIHYLLDQVNQTADGAYIFPGHEADHLRRQRAWRLISKLSDNRLFPHFFRHNRLNKLAEDGSSALELQSWAGWSDLRSAKSYLIRKPVEAKEIR